jgi:osmotically-inducible protein OsmY
VSVDENSGAQTDAQSQLLAARLAARVRGVREITNELKVRWSETTSDDTVRQQIVSRFSSNAITRPVADRIQVVVKQGVVTLSSQVGRSAELVEAERIAKAADCVRTVDNQIWPGDTARHPAAPASKSAATARRQAGR